MNCPICEKAGLPENAPVCSQCNSDLSALYVVRDLTTQQQNLVREKDALSEQLQKSERTTRQVGIISGVVILGLTAAGVLWSLPFKKATPHTDAPIAQATKDGLPQANPEKKPPMAATAETKTARVNFKYVVRKGDNLSKIAHFFYNNDLQYTKIMQDNQLQKNGVLLAGDTLTIQLKNDQ